MTVDELRGIIASRRNFATELHISPSDYDSVKNALRRSELQRDPNRHVEHFTFEGVNVIRSWEP